MIRPPLMAYDKHETAFNTNGIRLLSPILAEHTLEFGTAGSIHVEHPLDSDGDWTALQPGNIIRAPLPYRGGIRWEPFRIFRRVKSRRGNAPTVSVDAQHLFYDLNYVLLEDVRPTGLTCQNAIQWLFDRVYAPSGTSQMPVGDFSFSSDIATTASAEYQWRTLTGALIGDDNCVLNRWGGEFYASGLYFSICETMETARTDAFKIQYRANLTEVEESLDFTNTFSRLVASDNYGNQATASVPLIYSGLPFEKTLHADFSYSDDLGQQANAARFAADFAKYMTQIQEIEASYSVNFSQIPDDDAFMALESYEVGDRGLIYDDELGISTEQRIMKTVTDILTGQRISTETGNVKRSIARRQPYSNTVTTTPSALAKQVENVTAQISEIESSRLKTWGAALAGGMTWGKAANYTWQEAGT